MKINKKVIRQTFQTCAVCGEPITTYSLSISIDDLISYDR